ncbi:MAG: decaprenyl-phosphate phosphoribosyltransferase [candidate division Zixibacteria bacterium]|nr:decaprenyl-phosphate phosphoribosyltransferase [candidate division Zixibacteria bacterium]
MFQLSILNNIQFYIKACRPTQWVKNTIVFAGIVFALQFTNPDKIFRSITAFIAFCLLSSAVYLFNDVQDKEFDRLHPKKKNRPIAAGKIPVANALALSVIFAIVALILAFQINVGLGAVSAAYLLLNIFYSKILKKIVIIDVMSIAVGFVLRAAAGAFAINVAISSWLLISTILLALFLGFAKRRHEVILLDEKATSHRAILEHYSLPFLDQMISVVTASTVVVYALYTTSTHPNLPSNANLGFTIPFVLYGIFRYLYIVYQKSEGGSPTESLLTDKPLLVNIALWLITVIILLKVF